MFIPSLSARRGETAASPHSAAQAQPPSPLTEAAVPPLPVSPAVVVPEARIPHITTAGPGAPPAARGMAAAAAGLAGQPRQATPEVTPPQVPEVREPLLSPVADPAGTAEPATRMAVPPHLVPAAEAADAASAITAVPGLPGRSR